MRSIGTMAAWATVLAACGGGDGYSLTLELRTDYAPGIEFTGVETDVEIGGVEHTPVPAGASALDDFLNGRRIAELDGLPAGEALVRVTLREPTGALLATRLTRITITGDTGLVIVITRSCEGAACPGATDQADATECLGGRCVVPTCEPTRPETCGEDTCTPETCQAAVPCVEAGCAGVACLLAPRDARCGMGERCDVARGCVPFSGDAGQPIDGGMSVLDGGATLDGGTPGVDSGPPGDPSLVAFYPCETFSEPFRDESGRAHHGTCTTCPTAEPGRVGKYSCGFHRSSNTGVRIPHHDDFDATSAFTIALFFFANNGEGSLFARPIGTGSANSYQIEVRDFITDAVQPDVVIFTTTPDGAAWEHLDFYAPVQGRWVHVATVWDGSEKRFYVDGVQERDGPGTVAYVDTDILVGYDAMTDGGGDWLYFDGMLDDVRFYTRALGLGEIEALASP